MKVNQEVDADDLGPPGALLVDAGARGDRDDGAARRVPDLIGSSAARSSC
jgi:hypothetical protein